MMMGKKVNRKTKQKNEKFGWTSEMLLKKVHNCYGTRHDTTNLCSVYRRTISLRSFFVVVVATYSAHWRPRSLVEQIGLDVPAANRNMFNIQCLDLLPDATDVRQPCVSILTHVRMYLNREFFRQFWMNTMEWVANALTITENDGALHFIFVESRRSCMSY